MLLASALLAEIRPGRVSAALMFIVLQAIMAGLWSLYALPLQRMVLFAAPRTRLKLDRLTGAYFLVAVVIYTIAGLLDPYSGLFVAVPPRSDGDRHVGLVLVMAALCFSVLNLRLGLLYPGVIAERRVDLRGTLERTRGNWWRLWWVDTLGLAPPVISILLLAGAMSVAAREALVVKAAVFALAIPGIAVAALVLIGVSAAIDAFAYKALWGDTLDEPMTAPATQ